MATLLDQGGARTRDIHATVPRARVDPAPVCAGCVDVREVRYPRYVGSPPRCVACGVRFDGATEPADLCADDWAAGRTDRVFARWWWASGGGSCRRCGAPLSMVDADAIYWSHSFDIEECDDG